VTTQVVGGEVLAVAFLDESAADEGFSVSGSGRLELAVAGKHSEIFLLEEDVQRRVGVLRRDDDLLERVDDLLGGSLGVTLTIERDDAAEGTHRIRGEGFS